MIPADNGVGYSGSPTRRLAVPVAQIHGDRDRILPHRLTRPDVLVRGGGHLISMTHADVVNGFLRAGMEKWGSA